MPKINLNGLSASALRTLARRAERLAKDLEAEQPSYALAIEAGISDDGYSTVRWGFVPSYSGATTVTMADGTAWRCVGRPPRGNAECVTKNGFIEMIPQ